jgi:hypothetical protein
MTSPHLPLTASLMAWPTGPGQAPTARRATRSWPSDPVLADHLTPGHAALALRAADPEAGRTLLAALVGRPEPEGPMAALAGLAPRLVRLTRRWAAAGTPPADLADLEADLVAHCWDLLGHLPDPGPPERVVAVAARRASGTRRTLRTRSARQVPLPAAGTIPARPDRTTFEEVMGEIAELVATGQLTPIAARVLVATASGWTAAQIASFSGTTQWAVRTSRCRAVHRASVATREVA